MASELGFSLTAVLAASVGIGGVAWLLGSWLARVGKRRLGRGDAAATVWLLYNAIVHFTLVRYFIVIIVLCIL